MKKLASLALVLALGLTAGAAAPDDYAEVEVTASRLPGSRLPLNRVGAAVTVITEDEVARSGAPSLPALLQQKAGFTVYDQNGNSVEHSASLRGFKGGGDIVVVVDGMRINDPNGNGVAWNLIPMERIARIEIIRGGATNLSGPGALTGVIYIWTKSGQTHQGGSVTLGGGSFGDQFGSLSYGRADEKWDVTFGATGRHMNGWSTNSDVEYLDLSTKIGLQVADNRLTLGYQHHQDRLGRTGSLTGAQMARDRNTTVRPDDYGDFEQNRVTLGLERPLAGGQFDARLAWRQRDRLTFTTFLSGTRTLSTDDLQSLGAVVEYARPVGRHNVALLFDLKDDEVDAVQRNLTAGTVTSNRSITDQNISGSARIDLALARDWTLTGTIRYDDIEIENRDNRGDTTANGVRQFDELSPGGTLVYHPAILGPNGRVFVGYSHGFRPPTIFDLFAFPTFGSNRNLRPATLNTVEGGVFFGTPEWTVGFTGFQIRMKDEITYNATANMNQNVGRTERKGLEAYLGFQFLSHWSLTSELTWLNAKVVENVASPTSVGKRIPQVPAFQAASTLAFERNRIRAEIAHRFVGRRPVDFDDNNDKEFLPSHNVYDVGVGIRLRDWLRLDAKVTNVFDKEYSSRAIDSFDNAFAQTVFYNPAPGIGFHGMLTATF